MHNLTQPLFWLSALAVAPLPLMVEETYGREFSAGNPQTTGKGGKTTKRLMLMVYVVAAVVAVLYPTLSEARLSGNHNETLVRDPR